MAKLTSKNLKVIEFGTCLCSSDNEPIKGTERRHKLLFNITQISEEEVHQIVDTDNWEYDDRLIEITDEQLKYLADKE